MCTLGEATHTILAVEYARYKFAQQMTQRLRFVRNMSPRTEFVR